MPGVRKVVYSRHADLLRASCPGDLLPHGRDGNHGTPCCAPLTALGSRLREPMTDFHDKYSSKYQPPEGRRPHTPPLYHPPRIVQAVWVVIITMAAATLVISIATTIIELWP